MRENLRHPLIGIPILEWIRDIPLDIEDIHVSLGGLYHGAEAFGLDNEETIEFVRRSLGSLLDAGAMPAILTTDGPYYYVRTDKYGTERNEIIERVIAHWQSNPHADRGWGAYPFTMPENLEIRR